MRPVPCARHLTIQGTEPRMYKFKRGKYHLKSIDLCWGPLLATCVQVMLCYYATSTTTTFSRGALASSESASLSATCPPTPRFRRLQRRHRRWGDVGSAARLPWCTTSPCDVSENSPGTPRQQSSRHRLLRCAGRRDIHTFSASFREKCLLHRGHWNGFAATCTRWCRFRSWLRLKHCEQMSHRNGRCRGRGRASRVSAACSVGGGKSA